MELEDFNRDVATPILQEANSQLARLRAENERLQSVLAALRRPVNHAPRIEALRKELTSCWEYDWRTDGMRVLFDELDLLRRAKQEAESKLLSECAAVRSLEAQRVSSFETIVKIEAALNDARAEIARLSSPPQERAAIGILREFVEWNDRPFTDERGPRHACKEIEEILSRGRQLLAAQPATVEQPDNSSLRQRIERLEGVNKTLVSAIERLRSAGYLGKKWPTYLDLALAAADGQQHPDDAAVDRFAMAMKTKLAKKRDEGKHGWNDPTVCPIEFLWDELAFHVSKGDPVDVANFSMMIWHRTQPSATGDGVDGE